MRMTTLKYSKTLSRRPTASLFCVRLIRMKSQFRETRPTPLMKFFWIPGASRALFARFWFATATRMPVNANPTRPTKVSLQARYSMAATRKIDWIKATSKLRAE